MDTAVAFGLYNSIHSSVGEAFVPIQPTSLITTDSCDGEGVGETDGESFGEAWGEDTAVTDGRGDGEAVGTTPGVMKGDICAVSPGLAVIIGDTDGDIGDKVGDIDCDTNVSPILLPVTDDFLLS